MPNEDTTDSNDPLDGMPDFARKALRACFSLGQRGDWDPEAVVREIARQNGIGEPEAREVLRQASNGWIKITLPDEAEVLPFSQKETDNAKS